MTDFSIALVGAGYWGQKLIGAIHRSAGVHLDAVVDNSQGSLDLVGRSWPRLRTFNSISDVLNDETVEALVIATPASTHFDIGSQALAHGKHVLIEKPMTTSLSEAESLNQLAHKYHKTLMVGHTFLYNEAIRSTKSLMRDGLVGIPRHLGFSRTNFGAFYKDANVTWDLAAHDVSIACWLLDSDPVTVSASGASPVSGTLDVASIWLEFPNHITCHIDVSRVSSQRTRLLELLGEEGIVIIDDTNQVFPITLHRKKAVAVSGAQGFQVVDHGSLELEFAWKEPLVNQIEDFRASALQGTKPMSSGILGAQVVGVLEAINRSIALGGARIEI